MSRRVLVAGNWKMNLLSAPAAALARAVRRGLESGAAGAGEAVEVVLCPPFTALHAVRREIEGSSLGLGAQDAWHQAAGAFTGEVSPPMLADAGCRYVIVGHSERRRRGETDHLINLKVLAAVAEGLRPILCVGETLEDREAGRAEEVAASQLRRCLAGLEPGAVAGFEPGAGAGLVVAYEPVWAIGTGRAATPQAAQAMHAALRGELGRLLGPGAEAVRVLYGGSVTPDNAAGFLGQPSVDGALVGGASLQADAFLAIVRAGCESCQ